jgi:hypothetical protein
VSDVTKTYGNLVLMATICVVIFWIFMALNPAAASWRLIPGKTYDGHYPISVLKEPCWSSATSKCSFEKNRQQYHEQAKRAPRR